MTYFRLFQNAKYDFTIKTDKSDVIDVVQDIMTRSSMFVDKNDTSLLFEPYVIKDGETPEMVAYNAYGDPNLHWVIMMINHVFDVYADWPMSSQQVNEFCVFKYGADGLSKVHHWEIIPDQMEVGTVIYEGNTLRRDLSGLIFNDTDGTIQYEQDVMAGNTSAVYQFATYTNYEYEIRENDIKKYIKIIRPAFIAEFVKMFNESLL